MQMSFLFCVIVPVPVPFMQARLYAYCYLIFIHKDTNTEIFLWNGRILLEWRWWLLSLSLLSLLRSFTSLILSFFSPVQLVMFVPTIELFQLVWSVCSECGVVVIVVCSQHHALLWSDKIYEKHETNLIGQTLPIKITGGKKLKIKLFIHAFIQ